jgi:acyl-coenzyme A synthetase/AMP-(fatty) acid ligase
LNDSSIDGEVLSAHCATQLGSFKIPREFHFTHDPLPRTAAGKLRRSALREMLANSNARSA